MKDMLKYQYFSTSNNNNNEQIYEICVCDMLSM